ncbi:MAG: MarR family transcriptional regulator [Hyphomonas sp.]|nr:MarR family transcriptional regulator [Hyphomonas sp.]
MNRQDALFSFFTEIGILSQLSQTQFERLMPKGMTIAQFTVLNHCVRVGDGKSPAALARAFQVTKATMTSTLHRLEDKGLVTLAPDSRDGRSKLVSITAQGRQMREDCIAATGPWMARMGGLIENFDIQSLLRDLAGIRAVLDADRD